MKYVFDFVFLFWSDWPAIRKDLCTGKWCGVCCSGVPSRSWNAKIYTLKNKWCLQNAKKNPRGFRWITWQRHIWPTNQSFVLHECQTSGYLEAAVWHPVGHIEAFYTTMARECLCLISPLQRPSPQNIVDQMWFARRSSSNVNGNWIAPWDSSLNSRRETDLWGRPNLCSGALEERKEAAWKPRSEPCLLHTSYFGEEATSTAFIDCGFHYSLSTET